MAALGCMLPFLPLFASAALGGVSNGATDSLSGGAAGLVPGLIAMLLVLRLFNRARGNWPQNRLTLRSGRSCQAPSATRKESDA